MALKVTQVKSTIGNKRPARESVRSLGLKRIHHMSLSRTTASEPWHTSTARPTIEVEEVEGSDS